MLFQTNLQDVNLVICSAEDSIVLIISAFRFIAQYQQHINA